MIPISEIEKVIDELEKRMSGCLTGGNHNRAAAYGVAIDKLKELLSK